MTSLQQLRDQLAGEKDELSRADYIENFGRMQAVKDATRARINHLEAQIVDAEARANVVAATGHRPDKLGGYSPRVSDHARAIANAHLSEQRPSRVISGMALGWDQAVAWAAIDLDIPLTAAVPFEGQEGRWPLDARRKYETLLSNAAEVVYVTKSGQMSITRAMRLRNEWMADRCERMMALWDGSFGGTHNCIVYAEKIGRPIVNLWQNFVAGMAPRGVRVVETVPPGYRGLKHFVRETEKAALFYYHGREIWLPLKAIVRDQEGHHWGAAWAVNSSREFENEQRAST